MGDGGANKMLTREMAVERRLAAGVFFMFHELIKFKVCHELWASLSN